MCAYVYVCICVLPFQMGIIMKVLPRAVEVKNNDAGKIKLFFAEN